MKRWIGIYGLIAVLLGAVGYVGAIPPPPMGDHLVAADITYENLNANGDVGSGATQVAVGNHAHADYTLVDGTRAFTGSQSFGDFNITNVGDISLDSISSDAGTSINVNLGSDAGDDFLVDTDKLVVEGDTGNVGIGTTSPSGILHAVHSTSVSTSLFERSGQTTDIPSTAIRLLATKTTDMADGFGSYASFSIRDNAGVINNIAGIGAIRAGSDTTGDIIFSPATTGSYNERMRITSVGNVGIGTTSPDAQFCQSAGNGSQYCRGYANATASVTAATAITIQVNIPTGSKILSSSIQVQTALAGGETWNAALNDGSDVLALASAQAVAQWTEHNALISDLVTDAETDIVITKNGGGAFTAQGSLRGIVYYEYQTAQSDS